MTPRPRPTHCKWGHEFTPENTYVTSKGFRSCRPCARATSRAYRDRHTARVAAASMRSRRLRSYGLTDDQYQAMVQAAAGCCDLCGERRKLAVDHDHTTGRVRGLLCWPCNGALGRLGDDESGLAHAMAYIRATL